MAFQIQYGGCKRKQQIIDLLLHCTRTHILWTVSTHCCRTLFIERVHFTNTYPYQIDIIGCGGPHVCFLLLSAHDLLSNYKTNEFEKDAKNFCGCQIVIKS